MEHIIQIAVSCDDERIVKLAEESAANSLVNEVLKAYKPKYYGDSSFESRMVEQVKALLVDRFNENCMDKLAEKVAERLCRSNPFRAKVLAAVEKRLGSESED